ncbi:hypothetical protein OSTOST_24398, partial [Ostertagia ostertagi]
MTTSLKTRKGVLSRHFNTLSQLLSLYGDLDQFMELDADKALGDISTAEAKINKMCATFEGALYAFTEAVDHLEGPLTQDEEEKVLEHVEKAQELISRTEELLMNLVGKKQEIATSREGRESLVARVPATKFELPRLAVPEFTEPNTLKLRIGVQDVVPSVTTAKRHNVKQQRLTECRSSGCQKCEKKHHTSICFKANTKPSNQQNMNMKVNDRKKPPITRQNVACLGEVETPHTDNESCSSEDNTVLTVEHVEQDSQNTCQIFLLSGVLRAKHPRTGNFVEVTAVLDTGADRSFTDAKLAQELNLPDHGTSTMKGALDAKDLEFIRRKRIKLCAHSNAKMSQPQ